MSGPSRETEALFEAAVGAAEEETAEGLDRVRAAAVFQRIEADLEASRTKAPLAWLRPAIVAGVGVAIAAALVAVFVLPGDDVGPDRVLAHHEPGRLVFRSGDSSLGDDTTEIALGAEVDVLDHGRVDIDLPEHARVAVLGPAKVIAAKAGGVRVDDGRAAFSVEPHAADAPFVVDTGHHRVVVVGTQFDVTVRDGDLRAVHVVEGTVRVVDVKTGEEQVLTERGTRSFTTGEDATETFAADTLHAPWWTTTQATDEQPVKGYLAVVSEPAGATVRLDGAAIGRTPLMVLWEPGTYGVEVELGDRRWTATAEIESLEIARLSARLATSNEVSVAPEKPRRRKAPSLDPWAIARDHLEARRCNALDKAVAKLVVDSKTPKDKARAETLSAECLLRSGKKARALARFVQVTERYEGTPSGESALFETAKLRTELNRKEEGLATIDVYLAKYPAGRFTEPATMRRCELLVGFQRMVEARACLERYLDKFPSGLRTSQAVLLLATIARVESRWADGAALYRDYLGRSPKSTHAEKAHYHLIQCLRFGRIAGAEQEIERYLERYPNAARAEEVRRWREQE